MSEPSQPPEKADVAILGAGGAGQMAVLRAVLNHLKTVVFLGDANTARRSRDTWVAEVDNIPGFFDKKRPITATTREVLAFIDRRPDLKPYLTVIKNPAAAIKKHEKGFTVSSNDQTFECRYVVLCTGTMDVQPHIGGSIEPILPFANRGDVLYCIRCDGHKTVGKPTAVIGHRALAGEIAVILKERYDLPRIWVLTHGKKFEGDAALRKLLERYQIEINDGEILKVMGDARHGLTGFQVDQTVVPAERAFVVLGSIVYNELAKSLGAELNEREHLVVDENYETSVPGFYAAGDLVAGKKKQVYTAWDMAVDAVDAIDEKIRAAKRESRGT